MAILKKGEKYQLWIVLNRTWADGDLASDIRDVLRSKGLCSAKSLVDFVSVPLDLRDIDVTVGDSQVYISCAVMPSKTVWLSKKSFAPKVNVKSLGVWVEDPRSPFM